MIADQYSSGKSRVLDLSYAINDKLVPGGKITAGSSRK